MSFYFFDRINRIFRINFYSFSIPEWKRENLIRLRRKFTHLSWLQYIIPSNLLPLPFLAHPFIKWYESSREFK